MSDLFSHAGPEDTVPEHAVVSPAVAQSAVGAAVVVPVTAEHAFAGFTEYIHLWWPVTSHSVFGEDSYVGFEDGQLLETSVEEEVSVWAEVLHMQSPSDVRLSWHPGSSPLTATEVEVVFTVMGSGTQVALTHRGWRSGDEEQRASYEADWPEILARYARFMGGAQ